MTIRAQPQDASEASSQKPPIFIHAWFRSCSTYIWSKLRADETLRCYYEPLHESVSGLTNETAAARPNAQFIAMLRHPPAETNYFYEYIDLIRSGSLKGSKGLAYDRYLLVPGQPDARLHDYLERLIASASAARRRAALCFCRSQMRSAWMKQAFGGVHIAQIRNPADQWNSFLVNAYFPEMLLIIAMRLRRTHPLALAHIEAFETVAKAIASNVPMTPFAVNAALRPADWISIFLVIWIASTMQSVACCDHVLDIDNLSGNRDFRAAELRWLASIGCAVDFSDCASPAALEPPLGRPTFDRLVADAAGAIRSNAASLVIADPAVVAARLAALSERSRSALAPALESGASAASP